MHQVGEALVAVGAGAGRLVSRSGDAFIAVRSREPSLTKPRDAWVREPHSWLMVVSWDGSIAVGYVSFCCSRREQELRLNSSAYPFVDSDAADPASALFDMFDGCGEQDGSSSLCKAVSIQSVGEEQLQMLATPPRMEGIARLRLFKRLKRRRRQAMALSYSREEVINNPGRSPQNCVPSGHHTTFTPH